jgi:hypothetical protein
MAPFSFLQLEIRTSGLHVRTCENATLESREDQTSAA